MQKLTIAIPIYNEGESAREFIEALDKICSTLPNYQVDLLIINDGSTDDSMPHVSSVKLKYIEKMTLINLSRNSGHPFAIQCAIHHVSSPINIIMDADFQDDPNLICQLVERYEKTSADLVRVARSDQQGSFFLKPLFYGFRMIFSALTGKKHAFGIFGLYSFKAIQALRSFSSEAHYYLPGLVSLIGFKTEVILTPRLARKSEKSKMGLIRLFRLAFDAFFSFSAFPIRLASLTGFLIIALAVLAMFVIIYIRLLTSLAIPGWSSLLIAIIFFGGVQLVFLGILGEYVARIFEQVKSRPHFFIESIVTNPHKTNASASN